jgi:hypothetical protein
MTINDLFLQCKKYAKDDYWIDVFDNCAQNKFPRGIKYDSISHTMKVTFNCPKSKNKIIPLPRTPKKMYNLLMKIFSEVMDEEISTVEKDVKKTKSRDIQIADFVTKLKKEKKLTGIKHINLYHFLQGSLKMHFIEKDDLVVKGDSIVKIKNLKWDDNNNFYLSPIRSWSGGNESVHDDNYPLSKIFNSCMEEYDELVIKKL